MKKHLLIILGLFFIASAASAQSIAYKPISYQMLTVDATTGGIVLSFDEAAIDRAVIVVETANIRFCVTPGCEPTSTFGTPLDMGQAWVLETLDELRNFRAIRTGSTSAKLSVIFMKSYRISTN